MRVLNWDSRANNSSLCFDLQYSAMLTQQSLKKNLHTFWWSLKNVHFVRYITLATHLIQTAESLAGRKQLAATFRLSGNQYRLPARPFETSRK